MRKGERTQQTILERAAPVFNRRGFFGTSLDALIEATGLQKGGLYNHYASKEALAIAAFDHALARTRERYAQALTGKTTVRSRLQAIMETLLSSYADPVVAGGCIILNTAVEADDALPALRERAQAAMTELLRLIGATLKQGQRTGEVRRGLDPREAASHLVSVCDGALVLAKLYDDPAHITRARRLAHVLVIGWLSRRKSVQPARRRPSKPRITR